MSTSSRRSADTGATAANQPVRQARKPLTAGDVWTVLGRCSFAVISHVTPEGAPRSSGVVYTLLGRALVVAVAPDGWKARHIGADGRVAVTVPVRRGGPLALLLPIPPATISFHGTATVRTADDGSLPGELASLVPVSRRSSAAIVEIRPVGRFVTYGVGIPLLRMRFPDLARATIPVDG